MSFAYERENFTLGVQTFQAEPVRASSNRILSARGAEESRREGACR